MKFFDMFKLNKKIDELDSKELHIKNLEKEIEILKNTNKKLRESNNSLKELTDKMAEELAICKKLLFDISQACMSVDNGVEDLVDAYGKEKIQSLMDCKLKLPTEQKTTKPIE